MTRRVLAVRSDNNGDVILAGPALRAIAASGAEVVLACGPSGEAAAHTLPNVASIVVFEAGWIEARPRPIARDAIERFVATIVAARIDEAMIFTSFHQSPLPMALLLRLAGVARIGAISDDYPGSLLDVRHRIADDIHEVERALSLARAMGYSLPPADNGRLVIRPAARNPLDLRDYIVVHPGATVPARAWLPRRNRELVVALARRGERVIVTGGADDAELCRFVAGDEAENTCGATSFGEFAAIVRDARVVVSGNTSAAHVAAAVATPVVSLFAPTIPAVRFAPWAVDYVMLGDQDVACRGCRARICPHDEQICLSHVTVVDVLAAIDALQVRSVA